MDVFGPQRSGFHRWGNRLQVATARPPVNAIRFGSLAARGPSSAPARAYKRPREIEDEESNKRSRTAYKSRWMARSKYSRRTRPRRTPSCRRVCYKRRTCVVRAPRRRLGTLWPLSQLVKLKVTYTTTAAGTSGTLGNYTVSGINFTDPFGAGSTQQPLGIDQWSALYRKGKAVGCDVKYRLHNKGTTAVIAGITPMAENETAAPTIWDEYAEYPGTVKRMLSPDDDTCLLVKRMNTKRWLRIANMKDEEDIACTLPHGDSTRDYDLRCWFQSMDKATTNGVEVMIEVTYTVFLYERDLPARSVDA